MKGVNNVIGMQLRVRSNMIEPLSGKILKQRPVNNRISILTISDEFGLQWDIRVPNRALAEIRTEIPYKGETYKIY
ncbi:hypothetical protein NW77_135 [Erwinia phage phiEa2809]|uniref:Uncharacterized protein n=2 Tax=Nezavisimistyvirus TaxID=2841279 RepID=A0A0A0YXL2_9CAUD|nr:hypothetical protein NW77_135 [Erwinia phage phiEa2809]AIX13143.1 hypothetical protein NW77_135 [Erwinia phage phiEa2809]